MIVKEDLDETGLPDSTCCFKICDILYEMKVVLFIISAILILYVGSAVILKLAYRNLL